MTLDLAPGRAHAEVVVVPRLDVLPLERIGQHVATRDAHARHCDGFSRLLLGVIDDLNGGLCCSIGMYADFTSDLTECVSDVVSFGDCYMARCQCMLVREFRWGKIWSGGGGEADFLLTILGRDG